MEIDFAKNLESIQQRVELSCELSGRDPSDVKILAVSKKQSVEKIRTAYESGINYFGENYVQELLEKKKLTADLQITWDFIGNLQSKKVKDIVGEVDLIHSVDRIKILHEIEKCCKEKQHKQKILLQINIANEESKGGFSLDELNEALTVCEDLKYVVPCGIMFMPPLLENEAELKSLFKQAKFLVAKIRNEMMWSTFSELSMGTSHDYQLAIQEFSTIVRIGSLLLGSRD